MKLLELDSGTWSSLAVCEWMSFGTFKCVTYKIILFANIVYLYV